MSSTGDRIFFIDLLRGIAVVVMVMGHSIDSVLTAQVRTTELFRLYDFLRGFTAPVFLFVSGLAFNVATLKRWDEYRRFGPLLTWRLLRILFLFIIGYALHMPFFSFDKILHHTTEAGYSQFFQADVLHCVAATLLLLHALMFLSPSQHRFAIFTAIAGTVLIVAAPAVWRLDFAHIFSPVIAPYLNRQEVTIFPLFPYGAYLLAGVATGHYYLRLKGAGSESRFPSMIMSIGALIGTTSLLLDLLPLTVFPVHDFWKANPAIFAFRLSVVFMITAATFGLRDLPDQVVKNVVVLGQYSLFVYTFHILVVYGSAMNSGLAQVIGQSLSFVQSAGVGFLVLLFVLCVVRTWKSLQTRHREPTRYLQAALASSLLLLFLIRPY